MNPLRKHYISHPKFRTRIDTFFTKVDAVGIVPGIVAGLVISIIALFLYFKLPDEIKVPVTAIVSTVFSSIVIPLLLNRIKAKNDLAIKTYERNLSFYTELTSKIIGIFQTAEQFLQRQRIVELSNYIAEKYPYICVSLSGRQIEILYRLKDECHFFFESEERAKASIKNIYDFAQKFLVEVRNQGGIPNSISGTISLDDRMIERLETPELEAMEAPSHIPLGQTGEENERQTQATN